MGRREGRKERLVKPDPQTPPRVERDEQITRIVIFILSVKVLITAPPAKRPICASKAVASIRPMDFPFGPVGISLEEEMKLDSLWPNPLLDSMNVEWKTNLAKVQFRPRRFRAVLGG